MKKFKIWLMMLCLATLTMGVITAYAYAYNNSKAYNNSRWEHCDVFFLLRETEPSENCIELVDPLDHWTKVAIEQTKEPELQYILVEWENLSQWMLYPYWQLGCNDVPPYYWQPPNIVFKYNDHYYRFSNDPDIDWVPGLNIPLIPLGPIYGGWTGVALGWIVTGIIFYKKNKRETLEQP
ncbi:MAG: hypothetical protein QW166_02920 [Candidatus Bathyarchaeia archaeon]